MKNILYIVLFFPIIAIAQNTSLPKNTEVKNTITTTFSKPVILAYQEKAIASIQDFYTYINFYQNTENNTALEKELEKSIHYLFLNESVLVHNIFETNSKPISLLEFLQKCKEHKAQIKVSNFNQNQPSSDTYFTFTYDLAISIHEKISYQHITQKVYFFPSVKSFGEEQKNVWQLQLGEF
jgi:hypothetical protein